ncbi:metal ABC transporter solute-binding protein, Zn/Mn family [Abyssisolibacter fermentans]|uniref:metal ABC transporter solute-binding protein, Zn/Mn family n=1 Tax=Abyssisolibacter fermentans TaxID=1766203 RepID=UPI00082FB89E|nr:zinc ABC transporter substrate-binding protein [Abyssisolibacter fermentans]
MKKVFLLVTLVVMLLTSSCSNESNDHNRSDVKVAVSIIPQSTFVKAVGGDYVDVITMIRPGNSPANYQPTPREIKKLSDADIYFSIGVPTESANIIPKLYSLNKNINLVSLQETVDKIYLPIIATDYDNYDEVEHSQNKEGQRDPHIWMSPKRVIVMIEEIKSKLCEIDPEHKSTYISNAESYINSLKTLDRELTNVTKELSQKTFIIYHPSLGYFAKDYGLKMITIEQNGKDATAQKLQDVIDFANERNIKVIFYQAEFDKQQAQTIAAEINGTTVEIKPLASNYIENMKKIVETFKTILEKE